MSWRSAAAPGSASGGGGGARPRPRVWGDSGGRCGSPRGPASVGPSRGESNRPEPASPFGCPTTTDAEQKAQQPPGHRSPTTPTGQLGIANELAVCCSAGFGAPPPRGHLPTAGADASARPYPHAELRSGPRSRCRGCLTSRAPNGKLSSGPRPCELWSRKAYRRGPSAAAPGSAALPGFGQLAAADRVLNCIRDLGWPPHQSFRPSCSPVSRSRPVIRRYCLVRK